MKLVTSGIRWFMILASIVLIEVALSCSSTKHVPDGQYLLDDVTIQIMDKENETEDISSAELVNYLRQTENQRRSVLLFEVVFDFNLIAGLVFRPPKLLVVLPFAQRENLHVLNDRVSACRLVDEAERTEIQTNAGFVLNRRSGFFHAGF